MAFQLSGFQRNAFQENLQVSAVVGDDTRRSYVPSYQMAATESEKQLKRQKSELEKLQSVLAENERRKQLAAESKAKADAANAQRLAALELEYELEINRLLAIRTDLLARIRENEEAIVMMAIAKRKRLRIVQWQGINYLH